jgi:hypothetical protein
VRLLVAPQIQYIFIYDPQKNIENRVRLTNDLENKSTNEMKVKVIIKP